MSANASMLDRLVQQAKLVDGRGIGSMFLFIFVFHFFEDGNTETADDSCNRLCLSAHFLEGVLREALDIQGNVKVRTNFCAGRFGGDEKPVELLEACSFKALSNIRHDGDCRSLDLPRQAEVFGESALTGGSINRFG